MSQSTRNQVPIKTQRKLTVAFPPTLVEQEAIAAALSDADALIEALEQLIAKKRQVKQGAMQELLTGKRRLPEFSGEWEVNSFEDVFVRLNSKNHQIQTSDYNKIGVYPVVDQGKEKVVGYSDRDDKVFQCPQEGVVIFGDHTCIIKFVNFDFIVGADGTQILTTKTGHCTHFYAFQLEHSGILPTGYNRHFKFLKERLFLTPTLPEQTTIACILSDMDAELSALEEKLAKARQVKQGMMQELLTGRTRLIENG
jgi:type I restriction enzyme S subunit